jgi:hypothetical protein
VLKIFSIDDFEIISTAKYGGGFMVKYRYSYDNKYSWSDWEFLTTPNISTVKWDSIRFTNIQYLFELNPDYRTPIKIYEVLLYGDFQNVSANSMKTNYFGLKENCINIAFPPSEPNQEFIDQYPVNAKTYDSDTIQIIKENSQYQLHMNFLTQGLNCYSSGKNLDILKEENEENSSNFWNPYEFGKITDFYNFLSNQISDMLGFTIDYHRTDPDSNGIDKVLNEFQLHNIVDMKKIKVLVPENQQYYVIEIH